MSFRTDVIIVIDYIVEITPPPKSLKWLRLRYVGDFEKDRGLGEIGQGTRVGIAHLTARVKLTYRDWRFEKIKRLRSNLSLIQKVMDGFLSIVAKKNCSCLFWNRCL